MVIDIVIASVVIVNALFGLGVFLRDKKSVKNNLFGAFVTFVNLWIISNFLENEPNIVGLSQLGIFLRLDFAFAILALCAWFVFCGIFTQNEPTLSRTHQMIFLAEVGVALLFAGLSFAGSLMIRNIALPGSIITFDTGPLWPGYAALTLFFAVGGLWRLFRGRQRASKEGNYLGRQQIDLILIGFFISVGGAIFINLFLQAFYPITLTLSRIGLAGLGVLVILTAYAITRSKLFDLRLAIMRTVSFILVLITLALLYAFIFFTVANLVNQGEIQPPLFFALFAVTVIATLSFQPVEHLFRKATNKLFFQQEYNTEELLAALTRIMAETIDLAQLTQGVITKLLAEMRITKGAFLITKLHAVVDVLGVGYPAEPFFVNDLEDLFHRCAWPSPCYFLLDELAADSEIRTMFTKYDIALAMPIQVENDEVAILVLGPRSSGERYYQREINTLLVFSAEAGIAIQNSASYQAVKEFNKALEETVTRRTQELKESQEQELAKAKDLARLKDEFVFLAAHELRAPVGAIKGFVELAAESKAVLPDEIRHYFDSITRASNNLVQLINDLLEIARSNEGVLKIATASVSVAPIVDEILKELAPSAQSRNVSLRFTAGLDAPPVLADADKIREVITNLITNAIKYNREGGFVEVAIQVEIPNLIVAVSDNGYGIPKEDEKKIFEKFFRAENATVRGVQGTGLGLFICRMLVERMGGTITYSSIEGSGSTFQFSVPLKDLAADNDTHPSL